MRIIAAPHLLTLLSALLILISLLLNASAPISPDSTSTATERVPVLAYYYIWFDEQSWDRAKTDYPLLGRYSSDDKEVMLQHIMWAKSAGIDGFIVSWKSTDKLNFRLEQLIQLAEQEDFKLAIIYEGLDFDRNPLPVEQVDADVDYFIDHYASSPAFDVFDKPMIIWSGIWKFTNEEIQAVTEGRRDRILIIASEKNLNGYQRVSNLVDGNAYYWSSVNPKTHPGYAEKLDAMGALVHAKGGIWIAPAAPGFDALLIGGTTVVERDDGETLRTEMSIALRSAPDAIGLISWNEFSENSHIEPSHNYGYRYLEILAEIQGSPRLVPTNTSTMATTLTSTTTTAISDFDSSIPGDTVKDPNPGRITALSLLTALVFMSLLAIFRRKGTNSEKSG
jgi:glycosyl hydrolase family 99